MAASDEQVELLVPANAGVQANSAALSQSSIHYRHNLIDFQVKYGRKADVDKSWRDSAALCAHKFSCKRDKVLNFVERHVPVVNVIRTYKVVQFLLVACVGL